MFYKAGARRNGAPLRFSEKENDFSAIRLNHLQVGSESRKKGKSYLSGILREEEILSLLIPRIFAFFFSDRPSVCPFFQPFFGKIIKKILLFRIYFFCFFHVFKSKFFRRGVWVALSAENKLFYRKIT